MTDRYRSLFLRGLLLLIALCAGVTLQAVIVDVSRPMPGFNIDDDATVGYRLSFYPMPVGAPDLGDRIVSVAGHPVDSGRAVEALVQSVPLGTPLAFVYERVEDGGRITPHDVTLTTRRPPLADWVASGFLYWLAGALICFLGLGVLAARPGDRTAQKMFVFSLIEGLAVLVGSVHHIALVFDSHQARILLQIFIGSSALVLFTGFPRPVARWLGQAALGLAVFGAVALLGLDAWAAPRGLAALRQAEFDCFLWVAGMPQLALVGSLLWSRFGRGATPGERGQAELIAVGFCFSMLPSVVGGLADNFGLNPPGLILACPFAWVLPAALATAIIRHGLFGIDILLRPVATYALVATALGVSYAGFVGLGRAWLGEMHGVIDVVATVVVALAFAPLRDRIKSWLDAAFFRAPYDAAAVREAFELDAQRAVDAAGLARVLATHLDETLHPRTWCIHLNHPAALVSRGEGPWSLAYAPMLAGHVLGEVLIGPPRSGRGYTLADEALAADLCQRLAVWCDRLARVASEARERQRAEALAHTSAMQDLFLGMVSHELRTPVSALLQASQAMEPGFPGEHYEPDWESYRQRVFRQSKTLSLLVDDLLHAAQLQAGSFRLDLRTVDVLDALDEAVSDLEPLATARGLRIVSEEPPAAPRARADRNRLLQILRNLLHNAVKYSPERGVITVGVCEDGDFVCIEVRDQGPGVPVAQQERLFQRFGRAEGQTIGVGLGLYIVKEIVASHAVALDPPARGLTGYREGVAGGGSFWFCVPRDNGAKFDPRGS